VRKAEVFLRAGWLAAAVCLALAALPGCGSKTADPTASATPSKAHKTAKPKTAAKPGELNLADMVAAVSPAKSGPPVEMKFSLAARPEVGQVIDLEVALVPRGSPVPDSLSASFQAAEGIEIVDGSQLERVEKLVDGTPVRHVVKILPKRDGIFAVSAVVSVNLPNQDLMRTFSIPIIAGEGLPPEQVAKGP
jgi:hypothetical protein